MHDLMHPRSERKRIAVRAQRRVFKLLCRCELRKGAANQREDARRVPRGYSCVTDTASVSRSDTRPPSGMHAPMPMPLTLGAALNSVCAVAVPLTGTVFPPTSIETPFAVMNTGAFAVTTLRITCVPAGSEMPLLPLTFDTVVAVNLSPSELPVLHTRDPLESSSVVPGPIDPVLATGAGGGAGAGAGAGAGVAAGVATTGAGCAVAPADPTGGSAREGVRSCGSARAGVRASVTPRCATARCCAIELEGVLAGATTAEGASGFEWKMLSWLNPVTAAVIDPTSAAVAVR